MYLVVGCGLSGAVIAERLANDEKKKVLIIEKRSHIGGNCYDYEDESTGILMNEYGAHIFHTNDNSVWEYVNRFSEWERYEHKVQSYVDGKFVPMPVNITTVNELLGQHIQTEEEFAEYMSQIQERYDDITDSEQMAKSRVGSELYNKLIRDYTYKQWAKYPSELDKSVLERIPVRMNFDVRYFTDRYQALPKKGYTRFVREMINSPNIQVLLNTDFFEYRKEHDMSQFEGVVYTGPIDSYFQGLPRLEYRSIAFEKKVIKSTGYFQPSAVVNYPSKDVPFTRIVEYKHFLNQESKDTVIVTETTNDEGDPYYPVPNERNKALYERYRCLAESATMKDKVHFVGRLANYKYFNMDQAIKNALDLYYTTFQSKETH
jgi:UDP-galactopyranose mutase